MCGEAYLQSSKVAAELEPFAGYAPNRDAFLEVIGMHRDAAREVPPKGVPVELHKAQMAVWDAALESGKQYGYKNGQVTVLAPTGTIGFMMDCDTTGVEPDLALVKYKKLVGGGTIKIVNQTVPLALKRLGLHGRRDQHDHRLRGREGHDRGRAGLQAGAPAGVRLRVPRAERHALDPLLGPRPDDGGRRSRSSRARSRRRSTCRPTRRPTRSPASTWTAGSRA